MKQTNGLDYTAAGTIEPGEYALKGGVTFKVESKSIKYTKEDLIALGWTFDASGKAIPPSSGGSNRRAAIRG